VGVGGWGCWWVGEGGWVGEGEWVRVGGWVRVSVSSLPSPTHAEKKMEFCRTILGSAARAEPL
jgi:hypothetical protein